MLPLFKLLVVQYDHCVGRGAVEETNLRRAICSRSIGFCPTIWSLIGTLGLIDLCWDFSGSVGE